MAFACFSCTSKETESTIFAAPTIDELMRTLPEFWQRTSKYSTLSPPASSGEKAAVSSLGLTAVPADLEWLWSITNGLSTDNHNTQMVSVAESVEWTLGARLRLKWPPEATYIGNDGSDTAYALWSPGEGGRSVVLAVIDLDWEGGLVALVAADIPAFLWSRHAYYGHMFLADSAASRRAAPSLDDLRLISAPLPLSSEGGADSEERFTGLEKLARRGLPEQPVEWTTEELRRVFGARK